MFTGAIFRVLQNKLTKGNVGWSLVFLSWRPSKNEYVASSSASAQCFTRQLRRVQEQFDLAARGPRVIEGAHRLAES